MDHSAATETFTLRWPGQPEPLAVHVVEAEVTLLFGTGAAATADELLSLAADADVEIAVVEHGDPDHYGGAPRLREELGIDIAAPAGDRPRLAEAGVAVDHWLHDGETYWGVRGREYPGHTPGNMAFRYRDAVIAGDTVVGRDSVFAGVNTGAGPLALIDATYSADPAAARESARLFAHEHASVRQVLLTHGSSIHERGALALKTLKTEL